jgi:hypothetical protein
MNNLSERLHRRRFLQLAAVHASALTVSRLIAAEQPAVRVQTFTYKKVGPLEIKADVHRA